MVMAVAMGELQIKHELGGVTEECVAHCQGS